MLNLDVMLEENVFHRQMPEVSASSDHYNETFIVNSTLFRKLMNKARFYLFNQKKLDELVSQACNKAKIASGNVTVAGIWNQLQLLFRMLRAHFSKEYEGLGNTKVILGIAVALYFILPLDLIPDFIPLAGYVDDAGLLAWFVKNSANEISKFQQWEADIFPSSSSPVY